MISELTPLRLVWLACALAGAGFALAGGAAGWPATASERIAALVLALWCGMETMIRRNWLALLTLPALAFGAGCALPLYLFMRSRPVV